MDSIHFIVYAMIKLCHAKYDWCKIRAFLCQYQLNVWEQNLIRNHIYVNIYNNI